MRCSELLRRVTPAAPAAFAPAAFPQPVRRASAVAELGVVRRLATRMTNAKDKRAAEIQDPIRQILYREWDPIGVCDAAPEDEYDSYIGPVYRILAGSRSEQELCEFLFRTARDTIGIANDTTEHFELGRPIARKLLELDVNL